MGVTDRLIRDNNRQEEIKKKKEKDFYMEEEETLMYAPVLKTGYLNTQKDVFKGFGDTGINSELSIYDKQAVFKTR